MEIPIIIKENKEYLQLWNTLQDFVYRNCSQRDESHNHFHMYRVAVLSIEILLNTLYDFNSDFICKVITIAWLHDINDYKYVDNSKDNKIFVDISYDEMKIIEQISFSKQISHGGLKINWDKIFSSKEDLMIRHIVSDADKLDALGKKGLERMICYIKSKNPSISKKELMDDIINHSKEKLLILKNYLYTDYGRKLGEIYHKEFVDVLCGYLNFEI